MAIQRKPWESLSPAYRERLSRAGITAASHGRGESIRAARGHQNTPEHPREGVKEPERFRDWVDTRQALVRQVHRQKIAWFGSEHKFRGRNARELTDKGSNGVVPP